jgi:hypothetical protein
MKGKIFLLLLLLSNIASAQLTVSAGTQFSLSGDQKLTLQNIDLVNNGTISTGNSLISFTGNSPSFIKGTQPIQFFELRMAKTNNASVLLQRSIDVPVRILFTSGFLDLNGFDVNLGSTGSLDIEQENTHIKGANGGEVIITTVLNGAGSANPGNIGIFLSFPQSLGTVTIRRGHKPQSGSGLPNSIARYYDIIPENDVVLDEFGINYFDDELNGINENSLVLFKSPDKVNWTNVGFSSRFANFVKQSNVTSRSRWTLSTANAALAVHFSLFNAKCQGSNVVLTWKTAQEQDASRFDIERSTDGTRWDVIGSTPASGNSNSEKTYTFTDAHPSANNVYRIAEHDLSGRVQYTSFLRSSCNADVFSLWPNPFNSTVFLNLFANNPSTVSIKIFDSKGALVKVQNAGLLQGSNQLRVDAGLLANGIYTLYAEWDNGHMKKQVQIVKQ